MVSGTFVDGDCFINSAKPRAALCRDIPKCRAGRAVEQSPDDIEK
jgi:hypothetical protein